MDVRVLGPVEVVSAIGSVVIAGAKVRGVLALLALEAGRPVASERLLDALWEGGDATSANALQVAVSKLRRALAKAGERDRVVTHSAGYRLDVDRSAVDALHFEELVAQPGTGGTRTESLTRALGLWRGPALADVPETSLVRGLRVRLEEMRREAEDELASAAVVAGNFRAAVADLEALVAAEPLRERRWALLMQALYGSGQQAEALRAFARARAVLVEEVGVEPGPELRRLEASVLAQDDEAVLGGHRPTPLTVGESFRRSGQLPHPVAALLGRDDELSRLEGAVRSNRLVTLVGPGGVGKTRLALELARTLEPTRSDGVWWVDLISTRADRDVVGAVFRSLGLGDAPGGPVEDVRAAAADVIGTGDAVLVLDNCEHVVDAVAAVVGAIVSRCPNLHVVATSRANLDLPGELVFAVEPLSKDSAVALFDERVAGLALDDAAETVVARICERLDHLPLGIELAAGRARYLRLSELAERLDESLDVLEDGAQRTSARRGLRPVADWSYQLLDESERLAFECLSVFADGATLAAAVAVGASRGLEPSAVEGLLQRLVDQSLIYVDRSRSVTRYRMLQTLYDYASEQLAASGAEHAARLAHARWVADVAATVAFGARTTGRTVAAVQDEDVAVRDAIIWCTTADPALGLEIATALAPFWFGTMRVSTGWELLSTSIDASTSRVAVGWLAPLAWAELFATMSFDESSAAHSGVEATRLAETADDPVQLGCLALTRALAAGYDDRGDDTEWVAAGRREFGRADHTIGLGYVDFAEGAYALVRGAFGTATERLRSAIDTFRAEGDHLGLILAVSRLGELAWRIDDLDLFVAMHAELLELGRAGRADGVIAGATARLAMGRLAQGAVEEAEQLARAALAQSGGTFMPLVNGFAFRSAALVDMVLGHVAEGRDGLAAAIDAFGRGTGQVGAGYAALCWIDLSRSYASTGDLPDARRAAAVAVDVAASTGDPWVDAQAAAQLATVAS